MPWRAKTVSLLRKEFVRLVKNDGNVSALCRNFGISRQTGYKWINRYEEGEETMQDRSRSPLNSPFKVSAVMEEAVVQIRKDHRTWGGRKIRKRLQNLGYDTVPAASTITEILRRNGLIDADSAAKHSAFERFQREEPNDLWQMDFKGHVGCPEGRCHPLTILDDYSRYAIAIRACLDEKTVTVQSSLKEIFRHYGLPNQMIMDNGAPWGNEKNNPYTRLTVWLMRLGIVISHSRPAHPQTLGKDERFHRTFKAELLGDWLPWNQQEAQTRFDQWRYIYNYERPHEALELAVPSDRYRISNRPFVEQLGEIEYSPEDMIRKVQLGGRIHFKGTEIRVPQAFVGQPIGLRPRPQTDGCFEIYYVRQLIKIIDLNDYRSKKV